MSVPAVNYPPIAYIWYQAFGQQVYISPYPQTNGSDLCKSLRAIRERVD
jgi:hypothetical protein